jgi:hypothetical protein
VGGEGADGVEDGEAIAGGGGVVVVVAGTTGVAVAAGDLDPLDELLEALVVDEGGLPLGDDAGLVLPRELHHRGIRREGQGQGPVCRSGGGSNPAWRAAYIGGDGYGGGRRVVCRSLRERASAPVRGAARAAYVPARLA